MTHPTPLLSFLWKQGMESQPNPATGQCPAAARIYQGLCVL